MNGEINSSRRIFIRQIAISSAGITLGKDLFGIGNEQAGFGRTHTRTAKPDGNQFLLSPVHVEVLPGGAQLVAGGQTIRFTGDVVQLDAVPKPDSKWEIAEGEITTLSLNIVSQSPSLLKRVSWFAGEWEAGVEQVIQHTTLMDNILFLRKGDVSFFISLDFPYSRIDNKEGISYPPYEHLERGQQYSAHSLSIGACRLSGQKIGNFDRMEIEAVSTYIELRFPPRFERPMFLSCSITNRMTDVRDGRIFYSMYDNPTLALHPELIEEDLRICAKAGIEYYQVFEGVFDWPDNEKTGMTMQRIRKEAQDLNVKIGDYAVPQGLYCPHFNYEHRTLNHPEWLITDKNGTRTGPECLACNEYEKVLRETLVAHNRKFRLELICLDFLSIKPCYATNHGHEPGDVYKQVFALVRLMKELNALSPNFLVWSNSGNWIDLMPKLTWFNQNVYLTDPHVRAYASHLNSLKLLGDGRREQMVSVHESHFVPYRTFTNFEYYLAPDSRLPDTKIFEYSFLQGLAVTPNIGLGELRTFLNQVPGKNAEQSLAFIRHWLKFISNNFDVWKHTQRVGDKPGTGAAEVYAHILNDHGFLVLVNQNSFPRISTFVLNNSIGLNKGTHFSLYEVYPLECLIAEQSLPFAKRDESITCIVPANTVRIIQVKVALKPQLPAVFGLASGVKHLKDGYRFTVSAPQGKKVEIGLVLPGSQAISTITARQTPTVSMYTFPVTAKVLEQTGNLARVEIQFPREQAPRELTRWRVGPDEIELDLPTSDSTGFLGALVHNAFTEDYEVQLDVHTKLTTTTNSRIPARPAPRISAGRVPKHERLKYTTHFVLPFIETYGEDRNWNDDAIIELVFTDPEHVAEIEVRVNGKPVAVQSYRNPKETNYKTFYIELKGINAGLSELELNVRYLNSNK